MFAHGDTPPRSLSGAQLPAACRSFVESTEDPHEGKLANEGHPGSHISTNDSLVVVCAELLGLNALDIEG
jgi:hypothetical protein